MWEFGLGEHLWQDLLAVCVRMYISWLATVCSERGQKRGGGGSEEVRFMLTSVALVRGTTPDICNLCPLPGLSS